MLEHKPKSLCYKVNLEHFWSLFSVFVSFFVFLFFFFFHFFFTQDCWELHLVKSKKD